MARGNVIDDDENDEGESGEDEDFDAEAEDSDTSPKKGQKRRKSIFIDDAASEEDDDVRHLKLPHTIYTVFHSQSSGSPSLHETATRLWISLTALEGYFASLISVEDIKTLSTS